MTNLSTGNWFWHFNQKLSLLKAQVGYRKLPFSMKSVISWREARLLYQSTIDVCINKFMKFRLFKINRNYLQVYKLKMCVAINLFFLNEVPFYNKISLGFTASSSIKLDRRENVFPAQSFDNLLLNSHHFHYNHYKIVLKYTRNINKI